MFLKSKLLNTLATGVLASVSLTALGATPASATDFSSPGVYMCTDDNYGGTCVHYGVGEYVELGWANDEYSSIEIVGDYAVTVYTNSYYTGSHDEYRFDDPSVSNNVIGNDEISSFKVKAMSAAAKEGVYLYEHKDAGGNWMHLTYDQPWFSTYMFNWDDRISSIRVQGSYETTLFEHTNYQGRSLYFKGLGPYYGVNNLEPLGFNDILSSIKVFRYL